MKQRLIVLATALACVAPLSAEDRGSDPESGKKKPKLEVGTRVGQKVPQFKADMWDVTGEPKKSAFDSHAAGSHVAYVFMSRSCPFCPMYQARLAKMEKEYASKGIRFVIVYPTRKTPAEKKVEYHKSAGFGASMINDKDASIAKLLAVTKTPEIVLATKKGEIVFRGGIDDNPKSEKKVQEPHLRNACDDVVAGRKVRVTTAPLYG